MVKGNEHPDLINKPQHDLTDEEKRRLKYFTPKHLSSEDWDDKCIDDSLMRLSDFDLRSVKMCYVMVFRSCI